MEIEQYNTQPTIGLSAFRTNSRIFGHFIRLSISMLEFAFGMAIACLSFCVLKSLDNVHLHRIKINILVVLANKNTYYDL